MVVIMDIYNRTSTMDLKQIRNFIVLAETLNFRMAAEKLHMAQPPLSVSIKKLEESLGVPLFTRNTKEVVLTREGKLLLADCQRLVHLAQNIKLQADDIRQGTYGKLRIGFVGTATLELIPRLIADFKAHYNNIEIEFHESTSKQIFSDIEDDVLDLGLVRTPFTGETSLIMQALEQESFVLAVPRNHPLLASGKSIALRAAEKYPFVAYNAQSVPGLNFAMNSACQQAGFSPIISQSAQQILTVLALVGSNLGIALVPSIMAKHHKNKDVQFIELIDEKKVQRLGLALVSKEPVNPSPLYFFKETAKQLFQI